MHDAHDGTDGQIVDVESHDGCVNWIGQDTFIVTHCFLVPLMPTLVKFRFLVCRDQIMHLIGMNNTNKVTCGIGRIAPYRRLGYVS